MNAPVHQPGCFNIEAWDGHRWRGGMNRLTREDAIGTASRWAAEDGLRHRVFDLDGTQIFDSANDSQDTLRVFRVTVARSATVEAANEDYARMVAALVLGLDELPADTQIVEVQP